MASERTSLKGVFHFGDTLLMNKLEINLKTFLDWGLLGVGGWTNVTRPLVGSYGGDFSLLRRVTDPSYTEGTVYEGVRKDWAWEAGVNYSDINTIVQNPTSPATVYINGSIVDAADYSINYPLGRVVFNAAVSSSNTVQAIYSYRSVQVSIADDTPWWNELQYRSFRPDDTHFTQDANTGEWSVGGQHRIQMPAMVLESVPRAISQGFQLGDGSALVSQDVLVHVLAETRRDRNQLVDMLRGQFDNNIWLFNNDAAAIAGDYPLDEHGDIVDSSKTYEALVDDTTGHQWRRCRFKTTQISEVQALNTRLYQGVVRLTCELVLHD